MARYRERPGYCTEPGDCPGGICGKCRYNPRSGYAMFHYRPVESSVIIEVCMAIVAILVVVRICQL